MHDKEKINQLLQTENEQLQKLNDIVIRSIEEEKLLSEKLYEFEETNPSFSSRVADRVATFGGSWTFIIAFFTFIIGLTFIIKFEEMSSFYTCHDNSTIVFCSFGTPINCDFVIIVGLNSKIPPVIEMFQVGP